MNLELIKKIFRSINLILLLISTLKCNPPLESMSFDETSLPPLDFGSLPSDFPEFEIPEDLTGEDIIKGMKEATQDPEFMEAMKGMAGVFGGENPDEFLEEMMGEINAISSGDPQKTAEFNQALDMMKKKEISEAGPPPTPRDSTGKTDKLQPKDDFKEQFNFDKRIHEEDERLFAELNKKGNKSKNPQKGSKVRERKSEKSNKSTPRINQDLELDDDLFLKNQTNPQQESVFDDLDDINPETGLPQETTKKNKTNTKVPEKKEIKTWVDLVELGEAPLSKEHKKLFREGIFNFKNVIFQFDEKNLDKNKEVNEERASKGIRDLRSRITLPSEQMVFDEFIDALINFEITLYQFARPLRMRHLFKKDNKVIRAEISSTVEELRSLSKEIKSFEKGKNDDLGWLDDASNKYLSGIKDASISSKQQNMLDKSIRLKLDNLKQLWIDLEAKLNKISTSKEIESEIAKKKKAHRILEPWMSKKYPKQYSNYKNRINNAGSDFNDYYNPPRYRSGKYGNRFGSGGNGRGPGNSGFDRWGKYNDDFGNKRHDSSKESKDSGSHAVVKDYKNPKLDDLKKSEFFKALATLDSQLNTLNKLTIEKLSGFLLMISDQDLVSLEQSISSTINYNSKKKTKKQKKDDDEESQSSGQHPKHDEIISQELSKIFRPIFYLHQNIKKIQPIAEFADKQPSEILAIPLIKKLPGHEKMDLWLTTPTIRSVKNIWQHLSKLSSTVLQKRKSELEALLKHEHLQPMEKEGSGDKSPTTEKVSKSNLEKNWSSYEKTMLSKVKETIKQQTDSVLKKIHPNTNPENLAKDFEEYTRSIIKMVFDFPINSSLLGDPDQKTTTKAILDKAKVFLRDRIKYFLETPNAQLSPEEEDMRFLILHEILGSFDSFIEAGGHARDPLTTFTVYTPEAETIKSISLLSKLLTGEEEKEIDLGPNPNFNSVLSNLDLMLDYKKQTKSHRELWTNTTGVAKESLQELYPYRSWFTEDKGQIASDGFMVYNNLIKFINHHKNKGQNSYDRARIFVKQIHGIIKTTINKYPKGVEIPLTGNFIIRALAEILNNQDIPELTQIKPILKNPAQAEKNPLNKELEMALVSLEKLYQYKTKFTNLKPSQVLDNYNKIALKIIKHSTINSEKQDENRIWKTTGSECLTIDNDHTTTGASGINLAMLQLRKLVLCHGIGILFESQDKDGRITQKDKPTHILAKNLPNETNTVGNKWISFVSPPPPGGAAPGPRAPKVPVFKKEFIMDSEITALQVLLSLHNSDVLSASKIKSKKFTDLWETMTDVTELENVIKDYQSLPPVAGKTAAPAIIALESLINTELNKISATFQHLHQFTPTPQTLVENVLKKFKKNIEQEYNPGSTKPPRTALNPQSQDEMNQCYRIHDTLDEISTKLDNL